MHDGRRLLFLAFGFPPAAKSSSYRLREVANEFAELGWDVTVVNAGREAWENDYGVDLSMLDHVDPRVGIVELPLRREDQETDIAKFSRERAANPAAWLRSWQRRNMRKFPEPNFGGWRKPIEEAVLELHRQQPFDLVLVSCVPYVLLAAALRLHEEHGVPFAVDFRDGWSIDVVGGTVAFDQESPEGRWEARALESAESLWVVNDPIAEHYRNRYPELAEKVRVVRNGFDQDSVPGLVKPRTEPGPLRFGYLGSVNFDADFFAEVLDAWRTARAADPRLADATLELRGHIGAGARREASTLVEMIHEAKTDGVSFGGPVAKADVDDVYEGWDALVLMLIGGAFVTSGKVYEYMATGLPIASVHAADHDASTLLEQYPLWTRAAGLDRDHLVHAFREGARMAVEADLELRARAREYAERFDRRKLMRPAVGALAELVVSR